MIKVHYEIVRPIKSVFSRCGILPKRDLLLLGAGKTKPLTKVKPLKHREIKEHDRSRLSKLAGFAG